MLASHRAIASAVKMELLRGGIRDAIDWSCLHQQPSQRFSLYPSRHQTRRRHRSDGPHASEPTQKSERSPEGRFLEREALSDDTERQLLRETGAR